jgi:hypothetical protein
LKGGYELLLGLGLLPNGDFIGGEVVELYEETSTQSESDDWEMVTVSVHC